MCGVIEQRLLPSDDWELVKEELFLRLGKDSWDRIRGIFESSGRIVIEEREVDRVYYLCVGITLAFAPLDQTQKAVKTRNCTSMTQYNSSARKGERGRKKKQFFDILYM